VDTRPKRPNAETLARAAAILRAGGIVAFPTETVYGLGARAESRDALARLARIKKRPSGKQFAMVVTGLAEAEERFGTFPRPARALAERFWPGPLTIVITPRSPRDSGTVGLRAPAHPVAADLIRAAGMPLVATSANRSGEAPALDAAEVAAVFGAEVDLILDGGRAHAGRPSTVVAVHEHCWRITREGAISGAAIQAMLSRQTGMSAPPCQ